MRARVALATVSLILLAGCGGGRAPRRAEGSPAAKPRAVGAPVRDALTAAARSANVVIVVLDAARADHVGCYGYPRHTTPNLDALAKESVVFRNHFTPFPSTEPSTVSLLTGLYPDTHRCAERRELDPATFTLERGLKGAGLRTALFTSNPNASPALGIGTDFERAFGSSGSLRKAPRAGTAPPPGDLAWETPEKLTQEFGKWLARQRGSRFFAYCHVLPPHNPYDAPPRMTEALAADPVPLVQTGELEFPEAPPPYGTMRPYDGHTWVTLYDANLRWADWGVGEVVRLLRQYGVLDNTLLIVTADHGEAFGEHGYFWHAHAVYDELVHIPLLIRFPGPARLVGEVKALTQTVDILPTVLDLCRVPYPRDKVQGRSLLPLLDGEQTRLRDYAYARSAGPYEIYLVRNAAWSLMLYRGGKLRALYDLKTDPAQRHNVIAQHPDTVAAMVTAFRAFAKTQQADLTEYLSPHGARTRPLRPAGPKLSDQTRRELKGLGYVR